MKPFVIVTLISMFMLLSACGGSLTDEQRAKMKEGMKEQEIKQVTDAEIMNQAITEGRIVANALRKSPGHQDSLAAKFHARIRWVVPGDKNGTELERQLIDAMVAAVSEGIVKDNVQLAGDSVLYSFPVVDTLADKSVQYRGTWNILLSRKYVVLSIN